MSCQKGPTHHACAWQIGPFWQDTLGICFSALIIHCFRQWIVSYIVPISFSIDSDPILIWCLSWIIKYWKGHWEYRFDSICMMLMNRFTREKIISLQLYITCKCHMMMTFYDLHPISNYQASRVHDDIMKWRHFSHHCPFVRGIYWPPVDSTHKCQWHRALMFSLICAWTNIWTNNRDAGDLRHHQAHYDTNEMLWNNANSHHAVNVAKIILTEVPDGHLI